jgi:hypothetical protein
MVVPVGGFDPSHRCSPAGGQQVAEQDLSSVRLSAATAFSACENTIAAIRSKGVQRLLAAGHIRLPHGTNPRAARQAGVRRALSRASIPRASASATLSPAASSEAFSLSRAVTGGQRSRDLTSDLG